MARWRKELEGIEGKVVSEGAPTQDEMKAMAFGWKVVKHVKSNAIVYCAKDRTLGIGAGQMSRVDSSRIAIWKAQDAGLSLEGSVIASDAFFPFPDGLPRAPPERARPQPSGSRGGSPCHRRAANGLPDADHTAANARPEAKQIAMVFTGRAAFPPRDGRKTPSGKTHNRRLDTDESAAG